MAKKPPPSDRRDVVKKLQAQQRGAERSRGLAIVGVSLAVAVAIIGSALWFGSAVPYVSRDWYDTREFRNLALDQIGGPPSVCAKIITKPATGGQDHVEPGTPIDYPDSPPAFGQHYNVWESMDRKMYTTSDRPDVGKLVHNLEHGFTILWYDETAAGDPAMLQDIETIASKYAGTDNLRLKFKAAPWLSTDGAPFPDGQHIAFTHWSNGGTGDSATGEQVGVWQYCSEPSGAALKSFMEEYPYMDSPEPGAV